MKEITFNIFCTKLGEALISFGIFFAFYYTIRWLWEIYKERKTASLEKSIIDDEDDDLAELLSDFTLPPTMIIAQVLDPLYTNSKQIFVRVIKGRKELINNYYFVNDTYQDEILQYKGRNWLIKNSYSLCQQVEGEYLEFLRQKENKRLKVIKKEKNND